MTYVLRNSKISLPINSSEDKYFYVSNSDYYLYSKYLYFYLEDNNFGLNFNNIKYCYTNINPNSSLDDAVDDCSFNSISYYDPIYSSSSKLYHYKIPTTRSYNYSIIYYEGYYSGGSLYAYCHYESTSSEDNLLSTGAIIGIVIGSIAFFVICIIIIYYYRKNKNDFGSVEKSNYFAPINSAYPSNKSNTVLPENKADIPLQTVPMLNATNWAK